MINLYHCFQSLSSPLATSPHILLDILLGWCIRPRHYPFITPSLPYYEASSNSAHSFFFGYTYTKTSSAILCFILIIHYLIIVLLGQIDPLKFQKVHPPPTVSIVVRPLAYYLIIMFLCHYGQLLVAKINPPPSSILCIILFIYYLIIRLLGHIYPLGFQKSHTPPLIRSFDQLFDYYILRSLGSITN